MNWKALWMSIFHQTDFMGLNIGFWVAISLVVLIVVCMNVFAWNSSRKTKMKEKLSM